MLKKRCRTIVLEFCIFFLSVFYPSIYASDIIATAAERQYAVGHKLSAQDRHQKAFEIMLKLAKSGHAAAVQNVALSYYHGLGVTKNKTLAEEYFLKAHILGILDATNELANIYYQRKNNKKALEFWKFASDRGNEYASYSLSAFFFDTNKEQSRNFLLKAHKQGHPEALQLLEKLKL